MAVLAFALTFQTSTLGHANDIELPTFDFTLNLFQACFFDLYFAFSFRGTNRLFVYILHDIIIAESVSVAFPCIAENEFY